MIGGICTSFILELLVYPAIYMIWRERTLRAVALLERDRFTLGYDGDTAYRGGDVTVVRSPISEFFD